MVLKPVDTSAEEFYAQTDSCYVRIQLNPDTNAFRFEVRNEILQSVEDLSEIPQNVETLALFVRGMLAVAMNNPAEMYQIGIKARNYDIINADEELNDDEKELLSGEPAGTA